MFEAALPFPNIDPVIFQLGPVGIRWYGLAYIVGILVGWWFILRMLRQSSLWKNPPFNGTPPATPDQIGDLVLWAMLGIVIGGRLGWDLIYGTVLCSVSEPKAAFCGGLPMEFITKPWRIIDVREGGMSFHGGLAGVVLAVWLFCRKQKLDVRKVADLVALVAPIGIFLVRIANFINGELFGRITDVPWAIVFPTSLEKLPRHPSQIYEAFLEGLVLFALLQVALRVMRAHEKPGQIAGLFFLLYGVFRFISEFFREPDGVFIGPISMGMALSIPLWLAAVAFFHFSFKKNP
jgi:phosphatidylglycerol:prolipoprotein diacylglycerol transferase